MVAAAVLGWGRWRANERAREQAAIEQLEKLGCDVTERYWGPVWLARLVGDAHLSILDCPGKIEGHGRPESVPEVLALAAKLPNVPVLSLD